MGQVFSCLMKPPFHLPENPRSMSQGLSNEFNKDDVDGFSLLHAEYDDRNLSKLDFKLRSFMDYGRDFTLPAKKPRASTSPLCQVYGCNMDLSSSKDYHKRHRVCETHSKTSVAIVSGTEQRFCQQCSRFHLLSEFDDGKRSCRRSLLSVSYPVSIRTGISFFLKVQTLCLSLLPLMYSRPNFMVVMAGNKFHGSFLMDEQDHKYRARLMSFKDEPTCDAHSLLSAQSQQQFSETPNRSISITRPNQTFSYSTIGYHQMQPPLRTDPGKIKTSTQSTATVIASSENRATTEEFH